MPIATVSGMEKWWIKVEASWRVGLQVASKYKINKVLGPLLIHSL